MTIEEQRKAIIEDASRKDFEQWLFSTNEGFDINDPDDYEQIINQRETSYMWEAWQAARQSSQSEPVAYQRFTPEKGWFEVSTQDIEHYKSV
jgi:hypothetical protein